MKQLRPERVPGNFVFVMMPETGLDAVEVHATVREPEGMSVVLARVDADRLGLEYDYVAAWITLRVNSTLEEVGLTAAFSNCLAGVGISCNVLAGLHHDHILVPSDRVEEAIGLLKELSY